TDDEKTALTGMVKWIDDTGEALLAAGADSEKASDFGAAAETYQDLAAQYAGLDASTKASDALKTLVSDPAKKHEVDAAKALGKAKTEASGEAMVKKRVAIFRTLAAKWKDTRAAAKATKLADDLEHPKK